MPRIFIEITKAEQAKVHDRAKREGVAPGTLATWLFREKLAELPELKSEPPEDKLEQAA